jgi:hypothetical protein
MSSEDSSKNRTGIVLFPGEGRSYPMGRISARTVCGSAAAQCGEALPHRRANVSCAAMLLIPSGIKSHYQKARRSREVILS